MGYLVILHSRLSFLDYLQSAQELGLKVCFVCENDQFPPSLREKFDLVIEGVKLCESELEHALRRASILSEVKLYWTLNVTHVALCHKLNAEKLGLGGFSLELANKTQNKERLRWALRNTPFNPEYFIKPVSEYATNPLGHMACVIKPILGYSSIGVELVREPEHYSHAFKKSASVLEMISNSMSYLHPTEICPNSNLLVEEFIEGTEYSLEMFAHGGKIQCLAICEKSPMAEPYFEEISYKMPASLTELTRERLESAGLAIMQTLELQSGVAHLEVIDSPRGVIALDVGLRIGGSGLTHQLMEHSLGINLVESCLREGLGLNPSTSLLRKKSHTALLYLYQIGRGGVVQEIPHARNLNLGERVRHVESNIFVTPDTQLKGYPNYSGLPGYALFEIESNSIDTFYEAQRIIGICKDELAIKYQENSSS